MSDDLAAFQESLTRALQAAGVPAMPSWQAAIDYLARGGAMTRWNCGRCGYLALSSPHEDSEKGTEIHRCPVCGEQWWLDEFTYSRLHSDEVRDECD